MTKKKAVEKTVEAVEAAEAAERAALNGRGTVRMSSGVVFAVRPFPKQHIYEVSKRFKEPRVPLVFNEQKGRDEENPNDPEYAEAVERYLIEMSNATTDAALLRGTKVLEKPGDVMGPDDPEWIEEMEYLGYPMVENSRARYLAWLKAVAAPTDVDIDKLLGELGRLTGVAEDDVTEAVERFRRLTPRNED